MTDIDWVLEQGGWVSYVLAGVGVLLWSFVIVRAIALRPPLGVNLSKPGRGTTPLAQFIRDAEHLQASPERLETLAQRALRKFNMMDDLIKTLVAVAPLLGLLGTVIGMVEMFGSLQGPMTSQGESTVAGGISTALITTQLGLIIAAPGIVASYMLARQQIRRERELRQSLRAIQGASR